MKEYAHYKDYPSAKWRWSNFKPIELRSKSDNKLMVHEPSMDKLQALRILISKAIRLTSAYRSPAHNKLVGGAESSMHLKAQAYDVSMDGHDPAQFEAAARECGFTGFGFYKKSNFIHIDTGPAREWGERWFEKATHYTPHPIPDMAQSPETVGPTPSGTGKIATRTGIMAVIVAIIGGLSKLFGG